MRDYRQAIQDASSSSTAAWRNARAVRPHVRGLTAGCRASATRSSCSTAPTFIEGVHSSFLEAAPRSCRPTPSRRRASSSRNGARAATRSRSTARPRDRPQRPRRDALRRGLDRPRPASSPASDDPTLGSNPLPRARRGLRGTGPRPGRGRRRPHHHRDRPGHLEVKAAVFGAREAFKELGGSCRSDLGLAASNGGKMLLGTDISSALATLEALKVDVIGLNCSTGPRGHARRDPVPGRVQPRPGALHPQRRPAAAGPQRRDDLPEEPEPLANTLGEFVERYGVSIVGGCCGTTPRAHRRDPDRCADTPSASAPRHGPPHVSSMIGATPLVQEPAPTLVGVRVNSQGSRKAKSCCSLTTTTGSSRSPRTGRGRRARARPLRSR